MDSGTGDAAVPRTSAVRAGWMGRLTGRAGRAVVAAGTGTGTMTWAGQWTDARRAMGRLLRSGPRRPPESSPHSPGGSSSASNRRASRPSAASRAGSVACYAAAAVLVTFAAPLARPLQAQSKILVSNVEQLASATHSSFVDVDVAQAFTTGSNSAGYTLKSVELGIISHWDNATTLTVSIHSNSSGSPGARLGTLSNPASLAVGNVQTFTHTRGIALAASTTYFVVIDRVGANTGPLLSINNTSSDAQDPGRASGWTIGNDSLERAWNSSGSWTFSDDSKRIRVKGYNPEVINANIEIADASDPATAIGRRARTDGPLAWDAGDSTIDRTVEHQVVRQFEKLQRLYSPRSEEERVRRKAATKARSRLADREKQD